MNFCSILKLTRSLAQNTVPYRQLLVVQQNSSVAIRERMIEGHQTERHDAMQF
jgi:hypothetical protein